MAQSLTAYAENGPTHQVSFLIQFVSLYRHCLLFVDAIIIWSCLLQGLPPFDWKQSKLTAPHVGQVYMLI